MNFLFSSIFKHILIVVCLLLSSLTITTNKIFAEQITTKTKSNTKQQIVKNQSTKNKNSIKKNINQKQKQNGSNIKNNQQNVKQSVNNVKKQNVKKTNSSGGKNIINKASVKVEKNNSNKNNYQTLQSKPVSKFSQTKQLQNITVSSHNQKDKISELIDGIESGKINVVYKQNIPYDTINENEKHCIEEHYAGMVGDKSKSEGMNLDLFLEAKNKNDFMLVISGKNVDDEKQVKTMLSGDNKRFAIDILFDRNINDKSKVDDVFSLKENMVNFTYQMPKNVRLKYGHQNYGYTIALYFESDIKIVYQRRSKDEIAIKFSLINKQGDKNNGNIAISGNNYTGNKDKTSVIKDYTINSSANDKIFINHKKPIIVAIDAGHGGIDSGAIGVNNVFEKNMTLKYAKKLKDALNKYGFKVVMIRDADKTIPLGKRVKIAKDANADVYISLHTDAHENKKTHGTTIYSLSKLDTGHPDWKKFHNKTYLPSNYLKCMDNFNVLDILIDMTHKTLLEKSQVLTDNILARFKAQKICERCRHGQRSFAVLRGLDMVSILVEIGYITNDEELKKMQTEDYMNKFIDNLAFVIKNTFVNKL